MNLVIPILMLIVPLLIAYRGNQDAAYMLMGKARYLDYPAAIKAIRSERGVLLANILLVAGLELMLLTISLYRQTPREILYLLLGLSALLVIGGSVWTGVSINRVFKKFPKKEK